MRQDFKRAEETAAEALREAGHIIIARNYLIPGIGELDIVSLKDGRICASEVKARQYRRPAGERGPFSRSKQQKTIRALRIFLQDQKQEARDLGLLAAEVLWNKDGRISACRILPWDEI